MRIKFSGRQTTVTKKLKSLAEAGLEKVERVLGDGCSAAVVLTAERARQLAEVTVNCKRFTVIGQAENFVMEQALQSALEKAEKQALRFRNRQRKLKRQSTGEKAEAKSAASPRPSRTKPLEPAEPRKTANGAPKTRTLPVVLHSFPSAEPMVEPHVVRSQESFAVTPMTLEEAVKEAEFRDREVFVFRNPAGVVNVLYRKRDGKMALIEAP